MGPETGKRSLRRCGACSGFRSRAAFKLEQLDKKDRLFRKGMNVIDLGAAPGSWSQYAVSKVVSTGRVIALDRLNMAAIPCVSFIYGDFLESTAIDEILEHLW